MAIPQASKASKQNKGPFKTEKEIIPAVPSLTLQLELEENPIRALGFLLGGGADKQQLHDSTCLKDAQWAKEN